MVNAYVLMSNHLHLICYAKEGSIGLSRILADFKKFTANQILDTIQTEHESRKDWFSVVFRYHGRNKSNNRHHQVWIQDNHPIELVSPKWINQKINYIHNNPVRADWVLKPEYYLYSSAANYMGEEGLLNVEVIDLGITDNYIFLGG